MIRFAMFGGLIDAGMLALFGCLPPGLPSGFVAAVHDVLRASLAIKCARRDDLPAIEHSSPLNAAHHQVHVTLDPEARNFPLF